MKLRPFELALVIIFIGLAILALFLFSTYKSSTGSTSPLASVGTVSIWGTLPADGVKEVLYSLSEKDEAYQQVSYQYVSPEEFDNKLVNALADNIGPDLVLLSHEKLVTIRRRVQPFSYDYFPLRDIRNTYIDGAQIFALSDGLYGYPIAVDPLMMYWNRDILTTKGYLEPPRTWESLVNTFFPSLIERDSDRTVRKSVVAMGEYSNIRNAFGIISAFLLQSGSRNVVEDSLGKYVVQLQVSAGGNVDPLRVATDFYTRFSRTDNTLYSWNRSFNEDRARFASEDLVFYFGYGSEGKQIESINPNLNFDIAEIPQGANATLRRTYGKFYSLALLKSSDNVAGASVVARNLADSSVADKIAINSRMVPVYRSSVNQGSNDTYGRVAYLSSPVTFGWLNPDLGATNEIFKTMTQDINENRRSLNDAVSDASRRIVENFNIIKL